MNNDRTGRPNINPRRNVFDVVAPGRTPASPTSRPVVNSHKPVQDTSVTVGAPPVPRGLMDPRQKVSVSPTAMPVSTDPAAKPAPAPTPVSRPTMQTPAQLRPFMPSSPHQQPYHAQQDVGEAAVVGQVSGPQSADELPHHPLHRQHHSILSEVLAIVAIVFLIAVIVNILVDADVIDLPIPHTNFFEY